MAGFVDRELADELARLADESLEREASGELVSVTLADGSSALLSPETAAARRAALGEAAGVARDHLAEFTLSRVESGEPVEPAHLAAMAGMVTALEELAQAAEDPQ